MLQSNPSCFLAPDAQAPCFVQLGRYGDIILQLPIYQAICERTGFKPIVMTNLAYAPVLDGVSYVQPFPVHFDWWTGVPAAIKLAEEEFGGAIVPEWWNQSPEGVRLALEGHRGATVLQCHGIGWGIDAAKWPNFQTSMWLRAGFTVEEMMTLPVVFDRRDAGREESLVNQARRRSPLPMLLYNFNAVSAPMTAHPEVYRVIDKFRRRFNLVDLGKIRATRIYDLVGLYDAAVGLVTVDTATLHLASASKVPYVAYTPNRWSTGVPKGNCVKEIKYDDAAGDVAAGQLEAILESWTTSPAARVFSGGGGGGELRI